jgi:HSP20 family molecular chaperone IbpA
MARETQTVEREERIPAVDIYESPEGMLLVADLPGVNEDGLEVRVEKNRLSIRGKLPAVSEDARRHLDELGDGDFAREFQISEDLDAGEIKASFDNGVLRLEIPKSKDVLPRRIAIEKR